MMKTPNGFEYPSHLHWANLSLRMKSPTITAIIRGHYFKNKTKLVG